MLLSEAQREVLALYRAVFRVARAKAPPVRVGIERYAREAFRENARTLKRTDFYQIEYQMHRGRKFLVTIQKPDFSGVSMCLG